MALGSLREQGIDFLLLPGADPMLADYDHARVGGPDDLFQLLLPALALRQVVHIEPYQQVPRAQGRRQLAHRGLVAAVVAQEDLERLRHGRKHIVLDRRRPC